MKNEKEALTLTKLFSDLHLTGYIIFFLFLNFFGQLLKWNHDNNFISYQQNGNIYQKKFYQQPENFQN